MPSDKLGITAASKLRFSVLEAAGLFGCAGLAVYFLAVSWRKWPDPTIDFGMQLYLPWRIAHGMVLYRDQDYFYGPLSQYANAALFRVFGPSLMVLVAANLVVFTAILSCFYILYRRAWGVVAALSALALFISVFAFSQFTANGNYNYATPYAHEATHGLLVCLLLLIVLCRWVEKATPRLSFLAGILFGLTFLLKPEFMLAGALAIAAARLARHRLGADSPPKMWLALAVGALLPTAAGIAGFSSVMPLSAAVSAAGHGWLATAHYSGSVLQQGFLGVDKPWENLGGHFLAALLAGLLLAAMAAAGRILEVPKSPVASVAALLIYLALVGWLAISGIDWINAGRCLTGLALLYWIACLASFFRGNLATADHRRLIARLLLATLSVALLARMVLNARLYHYGFYQAVLAATMVPAFLIGELPQWVGAGRRGARAIILGAVVFFATGATSLAIRSTQILEVKTLPVGTGEDRFYAFTPQVDRSGEVVNWVMEELQPAEPGQTLMVLPLGLMLNYQMRMPAPFLPPDGISDTAADEAKIVAQLDQHPPDRVVLISEDMRGLGLARYGEQANAGQQILAWVQQHYIIAHAVEGNPLDVNQRDGAVIFRPKKPAP
jgi:hypothetical protein